LLLSILVVFVTAGAGFGQREPQRPYRGSIPWAVLLCQFKGDPAPAHAPSYFKNLFTVGNDGLADWLKATSYGAADLNGFSVHGWYTMAVTSTQDYNYSHGSNQNSNPRGQRNADCLAAAKASTTDPFVPAATERYYIFTTSPTSDLYGDEDLSGYGGENVPLAEIAHEFGHGINLEHSFSNDPDYYNSYDITVGDYDNQWDLMSAANIFGKETTLFGTGPPGLNAYHLDEMGWIPVSRTFTLGADGILARTMTIAALTHPEASGYLIVRVPIDSNPFHYYTVEFRTVDGWDAGIPSNVVMINQVQLVPSDTFYRTYLQRATGTTIPCPPPPAPSTSNPNPKPMTPPCSSGNGAPSQTINTGGVKISVISQTATQATISVQTGLAIDCTAGYVWRGTSSIDDVCVTPAARTLAASDVTPNGTRNQAGSNTCLQGFVWRQATPTDYVCVTEARRAQVQADNANGYNNIDQTKVTYGPNTCKTGFKWRQIDEQDYACVSYASYNQAQADDAAAASRQSGSGCKSGFVPRSAFTGDNVCVTPAVKSLVQADNLAAYGNLVIGEL